MSAVNALLFTFLDVGTYPLRYTLPANTSHLLLDAVISYIHTTFVPAG